MTLLQHLSKCTYCSAQASLCHRIDVYRRATRARPRNAVTLATDTQVTAKFDLFVSLLLSKDVSGQLITE